MPRDLTGQFGLTVMAGHAGWWVNLGQALLGDASRYTHAFVVIGDDVVEAMPGGARLTPLTKYTSGPRSPNTVISRLELTDEQRAAIVLAAGSLVGTPYSFLDYLALALAHLHIQPAWLREYIRSKGHMICSQLVDEAFRRAGIHLFDDDRLPQDVTPGDLADYLIRNRSTPPCPTTTPRSS